MKITLFYITTGNKETASELGHKSIEQNLAGCANIFPIQSIFPWESELQKEEEFVLILKTIPSLANQLINFITTHHPYEIPCIMNWEVDVNEAYGDWIVKNISK